MANYTFDSETRAEDRLMESILDEMVVIVPPHCAKSRYTPRRVATPPRDIRRFICFKSIDTEARRALQDRMLSIVCFSRVFLG